MLDKNKGYLCCKICDAEFTCFDELKSHLRHEHKISAKTYFEKWSKRIDRFDGYPLIYKSFEQYITCDFVDKRNYKKWLDKLSQEECAQYFQNKLAQYCDLKSLDEAPSQVEAHSINCLIPIFYMERFSGVGYNDLCQKAGLRSRFNYVFPSKIEFTDISQIVVDSREQNPFKFEYYPVIESKLEYGDYALHPNNRLAVERKSLNDLFGTLSGGKERFEREVGRAAKSDGYIVVVVESTLNNLLYQKQKFSKASGDFIAHNMRQLLRKYNNLQFVFCDGRAEARDKTIHILKMNENVFNIDLQYYFEKTWH